MSLTPPSARAAVLSEPSLSIVAQSSTEDDIINAFVAGVMVKLPLGNKQKSINYAIASKAFKDSHKVVQSLECLINLFVAGVMEVACVVVVLKLNSCPSSLLPHFSVTQMAGYCFLMLSTCGLGLLVILKLIMHTSAITIIRRLLIIFPVVLV
jgi:hypothetical protein